MEAYHTVYQLIGWTANHRPVRYTRGVRVGFMKLDQFVEFQIHAMDFGLGEPDSPNYGWRPRDITSGFLAFQRHCRAWLAWRRRLRTAGPRLLLRRGLTQEGVREAHRLQSDKPGWGQGPRPL